MMDKKTIANTIIDSIRSAGIDILTESDIVSTNMICIVARPRPDKSDESVKRKFYQLTFVEDRVKVRLILNSVYTSESIDLIDPELLQKILRFIDGPETQ